MLACLALGFTLQVNKKSKKERNKKKRSHKQVYYIHGHKNIANVKVIDWSNYVFHALKNLYLYFLIVQYSCNYGKSCDLCVFVFYDLLNEMRYHPVVGHQLYHRRSDVKWVMRLHCHWFWLKYLVHSFPVPVPLPPPRLRGYFNLSAWRLLAAVTPWVLTTALKRVEVETSLCNLSLKCYLKISRENWFGAMFYHMLQNNPEMH